MRKIIVLILTFSLSIACNPSDQEILSKTTEKLTNLESVDYELIKNTFAKDRNLTEIDTVNCHFDFDDKAPLIGSRYHFVSKIGEEVFNGNAKFTSLNSEKLVLFSEELDMNTINSNSLRFSFLEIRNFLPKVILDNSNVITRLDDVYINDIECYEFKLELQNKWIKLGGEIVEIKEGDHVSDYIITISKESFLPVKFKYFYPEDNGFNESFFEDIVINNSASDEIWEYSRFSNEYEILSFDDYFKRLQNQNSKKLDIGDNAPDFTLPELSNIDNRGSLTEILQEKDLVLLEFWFPRCKGCVEAIPYLKNILKKYKPNGFDFYGIEYTGFEKNELKKYIEKTGMTYKNFYQGNEIASQYGVFEAPTFFLINKERNVVYKSVGFDEKELKSYIELNLK